MRVDRRLTQNKGAIQLTPPATYCGWTESMSHHFETMGNHCLLVLAGGIIILGVLGCRLSSIHSTANIESKRAERERRGSKYLLRRYSDPFLPHPQEVLGFAGNIQTNCKCGNQKPVQLKTSQPQRLLQVKGLSTSLPRCPQLVAQKHGF